ncbi:MAG: hypothetical protein B6U89_04550 [Desulfurococcales archaeon ex4484_58]|nr:MAG: hypothetical protein B6U89_04550 [Desulfurococcales archaeon ex4484_58]
MVIIFFLIIYFQHFLLIRGDLVPRKRRNDNSGVLALITLFIVTLTIFLQSVIDYFQSKSIGAYQPMWQRILIVLVLFLSLLGFIIAYIANSRSKKGFIS